MEDETTVADPCGMCKNISRIKGKDLYIRAARVRVCTHTARTICVVGLGVIETCSLRVRYIDATQ